MALRDTGAPGLADGDKAWAHATVAELLLLSTYHAEPPGEAEALVEKIQSECGNVVRLTGIGTFHVLSTRRQFKRYRDVWRNEQWEGLPEAALEILDPPRST